MLIIKLITVFLQIITLADQFKKKKTELFILSNLILIPSLIFTFIRLYSSYKET